MRATGRTAFAIAAVMTAAVLCAPAARADTIELKSGYTFTCEIHDTTATLRFDHNPEEYVEFEIGTWTLAVPRAMTTKIEQDDKYQPPASARETQEIVKRILAETGTQRGGEETAAPAEEKTSTLSAEVTYLVNFGEATLSGKGPSLPVAEGDKLPEGTELEVKENSRAEVGIGDRVRVGAGAGAKVRFTGMKVERTPQAVTWKLELEVPMGEVWVDISGLEAGERVEMRIIGCSYTVTGDSLFSVKSALGVEYAFSYWAGPSELKVNAPDLRSGGFNIRPGYKVVFSPTGSKELKSERLDPAGMEAWKTWRDYKPVKVDLEPEAIPPPLDPLASEGVLYALREAPGGQNLEVRPEIKTNVIQDLQAYNAGLVKFREDVGRYPTAEEGLKALRENPGLPKWAGPYVDENVQRIDPWNEEYRYRLLGEGEEAKPVVYSSGQNRIDEFGLGSDVRVPVPSQ